MHLGRSRHQTYGYLHDVLISATHKRAQFGGRHENAHCERIDFGLHKAFCNNLPRGAVYREPYLGARRYVLERREARQFAKRILRKEIVPMSMWS